MEITMEVLAVINVYFWVQKRLRTASLELEAPITSLTIPIEIGLPKKFFTY